MDQGVRAHRADPGRADGTSKNRIAGSTGHTLIWTGRETQRMRRALERAKGGTPTLIIIEGAPGTGKSAYLDTLQQLAGDFRYVLAEASAEQSPPYQILDQWGVSGLADQRVVAGTSAAAQLLGEQLSSWAKAGPILLALDDAQWADAESLDAISWLLQRLSGTALLIAVATRPLQEGSSRHQNKWRRERDTTLVHLEGLSAASIRQLARERWPSAPRDAAQRILEHTGGNPLYVQALLDEYPTAELTGLPELPAPAGYRHSVAARVSQCSEPARQLLRALAVLGVGWSQLSEAAQVAGLPDAAAAADELQDSGLILVQQLGLSPALRLTHALTRAAVYQDTPLATRQTYHARAAEVVTTPQARLEHAAAATHGYDDALASALDAEADRLYTQRSFRLAAHFRRSASFLTEDRAARERRWLLSMYDALMGDDTTAIHNDLAKIRRTSDERLHCLVLGALAVWERRRGDAIILLEKALKAPVMRPDLLSDYRINILLCWARLGGGADPALVRAGLEQARSADARDPALAGIELMTAGQLRVRSAGAAAALNDLALLPDAASRASGDLTGLLGWRAIVRGREGLTAEAAGDLVEVTRRIRDGVTDLGDGSFHGFLAYVQWLRGQWDQARLNFRLASDLSWGDLHPMVRALVPIMAVGAGDLQDAEQALRAVTDMLSSDPWWEACQLLVISWSVWGHAAGDNAQRRELLAYLRSRGVLPTGAHRGLVFLAHHAQLAIWGGDLETARESIAELESAELRPAWLSTLVAWLEALVAQADGELETAAAHLRTARQQHHVELPLYRAHVLADSARVVRLLHDEVSATRFDAEAARIYTRLGAKSYARGPQTAMPGRDAAGPAVTISARENDVLTLLLEGRSYANIARELFITESTVSYHLVKIYAKFDVRSRHQLLELARNHPELYVVEP